MDKTRLLIFFVTTILAGCTMLVPHKTGYPDDSSSVAQCSKAYSLITASIKQANITDAEAYPVKGFPYLRTNRFLASLKNRLADENTISAWLDQLMLLDQQAKTIETENLSAISRDSLEINIRNSIKNNWSLENIIDECPGYFKEYDLSNSERINHIINNTVVPDEYSLLKRSIGLYPLTSIVSYFAYQRWKKNNLFTFKNALQTIEGIAKPVIYTPLAISPLNTIDIASMIRESRNNDLKIPLFSHGQLRQLAAYFAPVFLLDELNDADKIGQPVWSSLNTAAVDTSRPVSFVRLEHTWFKGSILPQLIYTIWFPERPKASSWDILGGSLDGIIWRITIAENGTPLIADTIHPCGCYHLFFSDQSIVQNTDALNKAPLGESIDTPQSLPEHSPSNRITLVVSGKTHYLNVLSTAKEISRLPKEKTYELIVSDSIPDRGLRTMPLASGNYKSLYDAEGIVRGTERGERWLLWPMGIKSPGAMRQWGKHATAFVGRRHFDDPYLFDQSFIKNEDDVD